MRRLLKKQGFAPSTVVTDKLRSYGAAFRDLGLAARHETGQYENNRAENSHLPVRRRERKMLGFKSPGSAQRFLAIHFAVYNLFNTQRHLVSRKTNRQFRDEAMSEWPNVTSAAQSKLGQTFPAPGTDNLTTPGADPLPFSRAG